MKRCQLMMGTLVLIAIVSSATHAGNIGGLRTNGAGNIGGLRTNAAGNIGGLRTNATGNIGGLRTNSIAGSIRATQGNIDIEPLMYGYMGGVIRALLSTSALF